MQFQKFTTLILFTIQLASCQGVINETENKGKLSPTHKINNTSEVPFNEDNNIQNIINKIYNVEFECAEKLIHDTPYPYSEHPSIYFCKALLYKWKGTIEAGGTTQYIDIVINNLERSIDLAKGRLKSPKEALKMNFIILAAHGYIAEQYYRSNEFLNAIKEGKKAYGYFKKSLSQGDLYPDFLYTSGLYNYYRNKVSDKHKRYKTLLYLFKGGDSKLGIQQLIRCYKESYYCKFEALLNLTHILMRYESDIEYSKSLAKELYEAYPRNPFCILYHAENAIYRKDLAEVEKIFQEGFPVNFSGKEGMEYLIKGFIAEKKNMNLDEAQTNYELCIAHLDKNDYFYRHLISLAYLYIAKLQFKENKTQLGNKNLNLAKKFGRYPIIFRLISEFNKSL